MVELELQFSDDREIQTIRWYSQFKFQMSLKTLKTIKLLLHFRFAFLRDFLDATISHRLVRIWLLFFAKNKENPFAVLDVFLGTARIVHRVDNRICAQMDKKKWKNSKRAQTYISHLSRVPQHAYSIYFWTSGDSRLIHNLCVCSVAFIFK